MDWTEGYVSDIAYTTGFYRELAPSFLSFAAQLQGYCAPDPAQPFAYCELGCGQGFGTNVLAAAYPQSHFVGIDFNPTQIDNARDLANRAELGNVAFRHESFRETAELSDDVLPEFDFISLHGIYAWISAENRQAIVDIIDRKLKPGGIVYMSYNCMPGWAAMAPFQRLLIEHADHNPDRSDRQVEAGMAFIDRLREAEMAYFSQNPSVPKRVDSFKKKDRTYLAHEYLNGTWQPLFFPDVAREMRAAKMDFVGSAALLENFESVALPPKAHPALDSTTDPIFREMLKDYAVNQQFRRDIFIKGARAMTAVEKRDSIMATAIRPLRPRAQMSFQFVTPQGEASGQDSVYSPIADRVAAGSVTVAQIAEETRIDVRKLLQAVAALTSNGSIHPAVDGLDPSACHRLNGAVAKKMLNGHPYRYLAAPGIGNGINATEIDLMAVDALMRGIPAEAEDVSEEVWQFFKKTGGRLLKDGEPIEGGTANRAELANRVETILTQHLPIWRELGVLAV